MYYITSSSAQVTPDGEGQPSNTRFKVVKIDQRPGLKFTTKGSEDGLLHEHRLMANGQSSMTYKRGRWTVTDFYDSPPVIPPVTQTSSNVPFNSNSSPSTPTPNSFLTTGPRLSNVTNVIQSGDTSTSMHTGTIVTPVALDANCTVIRSPPVLMDFNSNNGHPLAVSTVKPDPVKCTPVTASTVTSNTTTNASSAISSATNAQGQVSGETILEGGSTVNFNAATGVPAAANELHHQSHHQQQQPLQQQQQQQQQTHHHHHHHQHHHSDAHHHTRPHGNRKENLENEPPCQMENCDSNASVSGLSLAVSEPVTDVDVGSGGGTGAGGGGGGGLKSEVESLSSSPSDSEITTLVTVVKANSSKSPHAVKEAESTGLAQQSSSVVAEESMNANVGVASAMAMASSVVTAAPDPASGYATPLSSVHSVAGTCPQSVQSGIPSAYVVTSVAIDNKIEQAMDLVKSHLMFAVKEEVDVLKEKIVGLLERIQVLETENSILRQAQQQQQLHQQFQQQQSLQLHSQSLLSNSNMHLACNAPSGTQQSSLPTSMIGQANVNDLALAAASLTPTAAAAAAAAVVALPSFTPSASSNLETACKSDSSVSTDSSNVPSSVSPADVNLATVPST